MRVLVLGTLLTTVFASAGIATPAARQEPFFAWTELSFPEEELDGRRAALAARLRDVGGGWFLASARPGRSGGETFRQTDTFLYLTGLEVPDSVLAIDVASGASTLFVPATDARFESSGRPNDFPGRALLADAELRNRTGIDEVRDFEQLDGALDEWAAAGPLWLDPGWPGAVAARRRGALEPVETQEAFARHVIARLPRADVRNAYPELARLRMVKSALEIARLRQAARITTLAIREAAGAVRPGVDERTLQGLFEAACRSQGAQRVPFTPIVKSGPNSLWPWRILASHYDRRNRRMQAGDLVIFDVGCEIDYYISDVGRTFPVSGEFSARQREILEMEVAVADAVIAAVRPGVTLQELQRVAVDRVPAEHRQYMQAGTFFGHHIGMSSGDPAIAELPLEPGMVFTVEPWYYNHDEGISVFTEDVVVVTVDGAENLTASLPRTPERLERLVGARRP